MDSAPAQQVAPTPSARRRLGRRLALGVAAAVGGAVPLTLLAAAVVGRNDVLGALDHDVATSLHEVVVARPALADALGWISVVTHPNVMRIAAAGVAVWLWRTQRQRLTVWLALTMTVGGLLDPLLKNLVARARPVFTDPVAQAPGYSFPSGHALNTMLFAGCLVVLGHRLGVRGARRIVLWAGAALLVAVTGFDRVGLGVHYVSDVVAGWLVALATLAATTVAFESWRHDEGLAP